MTSTRTPGRNSMALARIVFGACATAAILLTHALAQAPAASAPTPANPWVTLAPCPDPSEEVLGAVANGKLYVFCGLGPSWTPKALVYEYDPATNNWTRKKPMQLPSHHVAFVSLNDKNLRLRRLHLARQRPARVAPARQRVGIRSRRRQLEGARPHADQARSGGGPGRQRGNLRGGGGATAGGGGWRHAYTGAA